MQLAMKKVGVNVPPDATQKLQAETKEGRALDNNACVSLNGGQKAHNAVPANVQAETDRLLNLCLPGKQKKAKKGTENLIRDVVWNHLFRIIKFIPMPEVQAIVVKKVRKWLNILALKGNDLETQQ